MKVKLRVVHGMLKNRRGDDAGLVVEIRGPSFVIGSGQDCHMRCPSSSISEHHGKLEVERDQVTLHDLASEAGTFVNDEKIEQPQPLRHGDRLRVGKLEFEVAFERSPLDHVTPHADPVADYISDLLVESDEEDRARRREDPAARQFHLEAQQAPPPADEPADEEAAKKKKLERPPKKPPGKLPPPPQYQAENTVEAAEETLKKIFTKQRR